MRERKLYEQLASAVQARLNCLENDNPEWRDRWEERIESAVQDQMPSGSGFDSGTTIDLDKSHGNLLVFHTAFHHMTEHGYDGWTEHTVRVKPDFISGFDFTVSGRDRNDIKDYIGETFSCILGELYDWPEESAA